ncbi:hypothetical protein F4604DRAFT_1807202 [Suillus subluteus]|nr:hypothetical protein F4604DRAFT_1807202 [Suillus subluteus]
MTPIMSCYVAARFVLLVCGVSLSLFICLYIQPCNCDITVPGKSGAVLRTSWIFEALDKSNIFLLSPPVRLHEIDDRSESTKFDCTQVCMQQLTSTV